LDLIRGIEAFLTAVSGASLVALRRAVFAHWVSRRRPSMRPRPRLPAHRPGDDWPCRL